MKLFETPYNCVSCGGPKTNTEDDLCEQCKSEGDGPSNHDLLLRTIDTFGVAAQTDMMIEEMAELSQALLKYRRYGGERELADVLEEMADVEIVLAQMKLIYGDPIREKREKLKRLEARLDKYDHTSKNNRV